MAAPRLAKLTRPRTDGLVDRERLFELLDAARSRPLVWVAAPPGAGKTSLLSSYTQARRIPVLWYQLDGNDCDPATFFFYLRQAAEGRGGKTKHLPLFSSEHATDLAAFARLCFRAMFSGLPRGAMVVLDNFQDVAETSPLLSACEAGFDEVPQEINVVALSRANPPAAFARLRAAKRVSFIEWDQIRLTLEETAAVADNEGLADAGMVELLFKQTGGWAAGLALMLERLRQGGTLKAPTDTENLDTIFDYFAGQIFNAAPDAHREMLMRMSYLPRMSAELAQAITGQPEAPELLDQLAQRNLFTDRRLGDPTTYQFHALFRKFLRAKAGKFLGADEHAKLTHSAAALLQATGQVEDAYPCYVETGAWDAARRVIHQEAERLVGQERRQTLRQWIQALPTEVLERDAWLLYWFAIANLGNDYARAAGYLIRAYQSFQEKHDATGMVAAASIALQSRYAWGTEGLESHVWLTRLRQALDATEQADDDFARKIQTVGTITLLGSSFLEQPFTALAEQAAKRVSELLSRPLESELRMQAMMRLAHYAIFQGDAARAGELLIQSTPLLESEEVTPLSKQWWYFVSMHHHGFLGNFDKCFEDAERGKTLMEDSGLAPRGVEFDRMVANFMQLTHGVEGAQSYLREHVLSHLTRAQAPSRVYTAVLQAILAHAQGRFDEALASARSAASFARSLGAGTLCDRYAQMVLAAMLVALGQNDEARSALETATQGTEAPWNRELMSWQRMICIDLLLRQGKKDEALETIRQHLKALQQGGYPRTILSLWGVNQRIFREALENDIEPDFCKRAVRNWRFPAPGPECEHWPWPVRIRALGGFELSGESIAISTSRRAPVRVLELLKTIVALGGRAVPRADLCDALWPESDGDAANRAFEVTLSRLRKLLGGADAIHVHDGRISLNPAKTWLDIWAFESAAEGLDANHGSESVREEVFRAVRQLYRGHLLSGESDNPAWFGMREAIRQKWLACVFALGRANIAAARWDEAAAIYGDALEREPAAEGLWQALIDCLKRGGKRAEAIQAYARCEQSLLIATGQRPSAETRAIFRSLKT
jgi:ATP/maltotriose-dependent transcriptional regulator MalT/DNA-binding SARP family transcriptional activator